MSNVVTFVTPGLIDPRCISTIGVSVKEGENPIGQFGTGLKYAISIILRHGGTVTIWRGLEPLRFTSRSETIRGKAVNIVCMNGNELGFTTHLGSHWKMWQAFREIYCNTIDEGGRWFFGNASPAASETTVEVCCEEFAASGQSIGEFILQVPAMSGGPSASFHAEPSSGGFYRGIRVVQLAPYPAKFAPNVLREISLTEDRTTSLFDYQRHVAKAIVNEIDDESFLERWLSSPRETFENICDLDWSSAVPSEHFLRVVDRLARDGSRDLNRTAISVFSKHSKLPEPKPAELLPMEKEMLSKSIAFCRALGFEVDEFRIVLVESLGTGIMGKAHRGNRTILLSRMAFQMGEGQLASTLVEEWVHIKHNLEDESRAMQNWLFDRMLHIGRAYLFEKERIGHMAHAD